MAKKVAALAFLTWFNVLTAGARTGLRRDQDSSDNENGICKLMVETLGYSCEEHKVTTEDGYILSMQRIPTGLSGGKKKEDKPPVVLQHGLLSDASTWLWNSPEQSLGFILADSGFDVWLTNVRGTNYSRGHTSFSPNDQAYWDWSWDELVAYDLPATLQYVHDQTGEKLHYVGHSLGTLMAFGAFSRHDKVLNFVKSAALLSPIAYMGQMNSPIARTAAETFFGEAVYWLGVKEFVPGSRIVSKLVDEICFKGIINCGDIMSAFTGPNCCLNSSKSYLDHIQPTATKNMLHLAQMIRQGTIAKYDYGNGFKNLRHYGRLTPPEYNMKSIPNNLPLFLAYGGKDSLSYVKDVQTLLNSLADHDPDKLVKLYREDYAHLDFVSGVNAKEVVYNPLMSFIKLNQ